MKKPVILAVDDDADLLQAMERDLRRKYGEQYRVMGADSGQSAIEIVRQLKLRSDIVALFLVAQRMPRMTGVEFLAQVIKDFPQAKRVLLAAYADTEAAISAINEVQIDHYLIKPWEPPEERLYPVLDDLLEEWFAGYHPRFEGIRVIGQKWSPQAHRVKYFLTRRDRVQIVGPGTLSRHLLAVYDSFPVLAANGILERLFRRHPANGFEQLYFFVSDRFSLWGC